MTVFTSPTCVNPGVVWDKFTLALSPNRAFRQRRNHYQSPSGGTTLEISFTTYTKRLNIEYVLVLVDVLLSTFN